MVCSWMFTKPASSSDLRCTASRTTVKEAVEPNSLARSRKMKPKWGCRLDIDSVVQLKEPSEGLPLKTKKSRYT